jgi:hypothetical protein
LLKRPWLLVKIRTSVCRRASRPTVVGNALSVIETVQREVEAQIAAILAARSETAVLTAQAGIGLLTAAGLVNKAVPNCAAICIWRLWLRNPSRCRWLLDIQHRVSLRQGEGLGVRIADGNRSLICHYLPSPCGKRGAHEWTAPPPRSCLSGTTNKPNRHVMRRHR